MKSESKIQIWIEEVINWINDQTWFQELRQKWDELDSRSKKNLQVFGLGGGSLIILTMLWNWYSDVSGLRDELAQKNELLVMIEKANKELRSLPGPKTLGRQGETEKQDWKLAVSTLASTAGIAPDSFELSPEKQGSSTDFASEILLEIGLKRINIKQLIRLAHSLEGGNYPIKVRDISIETVGPEGFLNGKINLSAFNMKQ